VQNQLNCQIFQDMINNESISILIVEDSTAMNKILQKKFSDDGFVCHSATTLKEARSILVKEKIDYIMLDIHLPDGNGYEIIKEQELKDTKIFVLTTENDSQFRESTFQKGVVDFVLKDKGFFKKINELEKVIISLEKNKFKNILVIDDSYVIQMQLKELFENRNYNVITVATEKEALDVLSLSNIHLILLDLELQESSGIDFLHNNREHIILERKIPIMILSGKITPSSMRDGFKAGAVDILSKPYVIEELVLKVDLWIEFNRREYELECNQLLLSQYKETVDRSSIVSKSDKKGKITYINEAFIEISGYTEAELLGKNHNIVRDPDMPKEIFFDLWNTISIEKKPWKGQIKNRKKDGSFYWVDTIINPILDTDNNVIEFIAIRKDITEHKLIEKHFKNELHTKDISFQQVLKLSKQYELAINESNILSRTNLSGTITYVNNKFCETSGYSKEEIIGRNHSILRHPDTHDYLLQELWATIKDGKLWKGIIKNKAKNGTTYWVDTTIVPILDKNNNITEYMAIRHDLTELFNLHKEIEETQKEVIYKMGEIGETRSKETGNHVKRVAEYSRLLAILYGIDKEKANILFTASPMHDIGKVGIPDSILKKPGRLTKEEFEIMKTHVEIGYNILKGSTREVLQTAAIVANEHHEKWDGSGYPQGLKDENIHIFGRITALADVFDALGSERCYKEAWKDEEIFKLLKEESGKHFDPKLIELFFDNFEKFDEIRKKYKDN